MSFYGYMLKTCKFYKFVLNSLDTMKQLGNIKLLKFFRDLIVIFYSMKA